MKRLLLVVSVAVLTLTACGGDDGAQDTIALDQGTDGGGETGGGAKSGGGTDDGGSGSPGNNDRPASLSDDFAIDIAPGWVFDALGELGLTNTTGAQLYYPEGAFDDVVAYYDDWTGSQPVGYTRTEIDGEVIFQSQETPIVLIAVTPGHEERGVSYTYLLIAVGESG